VIEHRSLLELSLSIEKSFSCVIEQLVIWHYILMELSLEVQGGQDYFRFVEGTYIIARVLSFSTLLLIIRCTKTLNSLRLWTTSDSEPENSSSESKEHLLLMRRFWWTCFWWRHHFRSTLYFRSTILQTLQAFFLLILLLSFVLLEPFKDIKFCLWSCTLEQILAYPIDNF